MSQYIKNGYYQQKGKMNIMKEKRAKKTKIIVHVSEFFSVSVVIALSIVAVEQLLPSSPHPLRLQIFLWLFVAANSIILYSKALGLREDITALLNKASVGG